MTFLVIFGLIVAALFAVVFFTKRRIGMPILALAAGALLASMWVGDLTPIIAQAGIVIIQPPLESLVAVALTLLPALLVSSASGSYGNTMQQAVASAIFALFATALLLPYIGSALVIDEAGRPVYEFFADYRSLIVTAGLVAGILDLVIVKKPKSGKH